MTDNCIIQGDAREIPLEDNSVDYIVTSPPYWGQRKYRGRSLVWKWEVGARHGVAVQKAGENCRHRWRRRTWYTERSAGSVTAEAFSKAGAGNIRRIKKARCRKDSICAICGAWKGQLGLEPTPGLYIQHLVEIYRERRRGGSEQFHPPGQNPHDGTSFQRLDREGRNSRMDQDREVFPSAARKVRPDSRFPTPCFIAASARCGGWRFRSRAASSITQRSPKSSSSP